MKTNKIARHGDILFVKSNKIVGEKKNTKTVVLGEVTLDCKCHKVTDDGRVWSKVNQVSKKGVQGFQNIETRNWNVLNCAITNKGYLQVSIHGKLWRVNRLVATCFIENPENYNEVHHIDDEKTNNSVDNLRWGNAKQNAKDRRENGKQVEGSDSPNAKISESTALEIFNTAGTLQGIADKYGISKKTVLLIKQKKTWKHIHNDVYSVVVAEGESSGNMHTLTSNYPITVCYADDTEVKTVDIIEEATITHQEHKPITLEKGSYRVFRKFEYDPFGEVLRKVKD